MMFRAASLLALVAYVAAQADPSINTPAAVVQCQPAQITYTATRSPVFISIIPGGQPSAAPLQDLGQQTASPFTWVANIASGTSITFQIRDSSGAVAYSAPITIQNSADASCLGAQASTAPATSAPATSAPATSAATSSAAGSASSAIASVSSAASSAVSSVSASVSSVVASATSRATATSPASSTRAATATSATPSASAPANNAAVPNAKVGLAGLLGLAAAVVMA